MIALSMRCGLRFVALVLSFALADSATLFSQEPDSAPASEVVADEANASDSKQAFPIPESWRELVPGIEIGLAATQEPRPLRAVVARFDLTTSGLQFITTPGNGEAELETTGRLTSTFLLEHEALIAINAGPFQPVLLVEGKGHDVLGLQVSEGEVVSVGEPSTPTLWGSNDGVVSITNESPDPANVRWAVPGFEQILKRSEVTARDEALHPRTAVGLSENGRTMIWLVVDGRQEGYSEGATTRELALWLQNLGMSEGINLDGGGTSTMVVPDSMKLGGYDLLNRPIHAGIPGLQRVSGSHLGIRLAPEAQADQDEASGDRER